MRPVRTLYSPILNYFLTPLIIPLLKEYFHGDWESICAVLNQDYNSVGDNGLLINKFATNEHLFKNNPRFSEKVKKRKNYKLNSDFSIDDLKTII